MKAGIKTSEFWSVVGFFVLAGLVCTEKVGVGDSDVAERIFLIGTFALAALYLVCRCALKIADAASDKYYFADNRLTFKKFVLGGDPLRAPGSDPVRGQGDAGGPGAVGGAVGSPTAVSEDVQPSAGGIG